MFNFVFFLSFDSFLDSEYAFVDDAWRFANNHYSNYSNYTHTEAVSFSSDVSKDGTRMAYFGYGKHTVYSAKPLSAMVGRTSWTIKIENQARFRFGICEINAKERSSNLSICTLDQKINSSSWYVTNDGNLFSNTTEHVVRPSIRMEPANDIILTLVWDQFTTQLGQISYLVNGKNRGVAFSNIPCGGDKKNYYHLFVFLQGRGTRVSIVDTI